MIPITAGFTVTNSEQHGVTSHLSCLHLFGSPSEGNIRVVVGGAIPLFLFNLGDERRSSAILTLSYPVVIYGLNKVVILI